MEEWNLEEYWEEFIMEDYAVLPERKGRSHLLYECYAIEIQLDEELYSKLESEGGK